MIEKKKVENNKKQEKTSILVHLFFILFGAACIIPFITIMNFSINFIVLSSLISIHKKNWNNIRCKKIKVYKI